MKRIYAIPGLGTTKEIFRELKLPGCELVILDWPVPTGNETLKNYSERFLDMIDTSSPFYLMGVSFGGMICVELNDILKPERTFLISSIKYRSELPLLFRLFKYFPLHKLVGEKILRRMNANADNIVGIKKEDMEEFVEMMNRMSPNYYTNCITYIVNWNRKSIGKNITHMHGDSDKLLPISNIKADHVIKNGTHAMIFYQAKELSDIINSNL